MEPVRCIANSCACFVAGLYNFQEGVFSPLRAAALLCREHSGGHGTAAVHSTALLLRGASGRG